MQRLGVEYQNIEPADFLAKHQENVDAFSRRHGRAARSATLAEITADEAAQDTTLLRKVGRGGYVAILVWFLVPTLGAGTFSHAAGWRRGALAVCIGAALFAFAHLIVGPAQRRRAVMQSHAPRNPTPGAAP